MTVDLASEKWISGNCYGHFYGNRVDIPADICQGCPLVLLCDVITSENQSH